MEVDLVGAVEVEAEVAERDKLFFASQRIKKVYEIAASDLLARRYLTIHHLACNLAIFSIH